MRPSHVSCHGFDVTRDSIAQLKTYQCISKSLPFKLDTSNKRLLKWHAHAINLSVCACQPWVTTGEEKPATVRVLDPGNMTKSVCKTICRPDGKQRMQQIFFNCAALWSWSQRGEKRQICFNEFYLTKKAGVWKQVVMENAFQTYAWCGQKCFSSGSLWWQSTVLVPGSNSPAQMNTWKWSTAIHHPPHVLHVSLTKSHAAVCYATTSSFRTLCWGLQAKLTLMKYFPCWP